MHSEHPDKDAGNFWQAVEQQRADGDFTFRGYVFPSEADFSDWQFSLPADFGEATFSRIADFSGVIFSGEAHFYGATFSGLADFSGATFSKETDFRVARFSTLAHFFGATFSGEANFFGAMFSGEANFSEATFSDEAIFMRTLFTGEAVFSYARFAGYTLFDGVAFGAGIRFHSVDLQHVVFRSVDLQYCPFGDSRNLDRAEFHNVTWARWPPKSRRGNRARKVVLDEWFARGYLPPPTSLPQSQLLAAAESVYRDIRRSYEAHKDHPRISDFYFGEMEMRRLASAQVSIRVGNRELRWLSRGLGALLRTVGSLTALYWLLSGYGERWVRALVWFCGIVLLWAVLYLDAGLWVKAPGPDLNNDSAAKTVLLFVGFGEADSTFQPVVGLPERVGHALLHSFLVATLIGRDVHAQPINMQGEIYQAVELILGPLCLGLMGLAIRRRFQR